MLCEPLTCGAAVTLARMLNILANVWPVEAATKSLQGLGDPKVATPQRAVNQLENLGVKVEGYQEFSDLVASPRCLPTAVQ